MCNVKYNFKAEDKATGPLELISEGIIKLHFRSINEDMSEVFRCTGNLLIYNDDGVNTVELIIKRARLVFWAKDDAKEGEWMFVDVRQKPWIVEDGALSEADIIALYIRLFPDAGPPKGAKT